MEAMPKQFCITACRMKQSFLSSQCIVIKTIGSFIVVGLYCQIQCITCYKLCRYFIHSTWVKQQSVLASGRDRNRSLVEGIAVEPARIVNLQGSQFYSVIYVKLSTAEDPMQIWLTPELDVGQVEAFTRIVFLAESRNTLSRGWINITDGEAQF